MARDRRRSVSMHGDLLLRLKVLCSRIRSGESDHALVIELMGPDHKISKTNPTGIVTALVERFIRENGGCPELEQPHAVEADDEPLPETEQLFAEMLEAEAEHGQGSDEAAAASSAWARAAMPACVDPSPPPEDLGDREFKLIDFGLYPQDVI